MSPAPFFSNSGRAKSQLPRLHQRYFDVRHVEQVCSFLNNLFAASDLSFILTQQTPKKFQDE
jgi:hypothetical protein